MNFLKRAYYKTLFKLLRFAEGDKVYGNILSGTSPFWIAPDTTKYIEDGYQFNPIVYSTVNLITSAISGVPFKLFELKDTKSLNTYKALDQNSFRALKIKQQDFEEVGNHRILDILDCPNPNQGKSEFIKNAIGFKLVTGNSYIYGTGPDSGANAGQVHEMYVLPPQNMQIKINDKGMPDKYILQDVHTSSIEPENILHLKYWNPNPNMKLYGMSPIQAARQLIQTSNDGYTAALKLLQNGGAIGALTQKLDDRVNPLTEAQRDQMEDSYQQRYGGVHNRGRIMITNVPMEWNQFGMNAVDLAIIEQNKMTKRDICNIYNVPSQLLNDAESATYSNMREARKAMITQAALPELKSLRDELNRWFVVPFSKAEGKQYYLDIDTTAIPELQKEMGDLVTQLSQSWWLTPNERRVMMNEDQSSDPSMDMFWIPSNYIPTGTMEDAMKQLYYDANTKADS